MQLVKYVIVHLKKTLLPLDALIENFKFSQVDEIRA